MSKNILEMFKTIARENDCYKVILDCNDEVKKVYNSSGFEEKGDTNGNISLELNNSFFLFFIL